MMQNCDGYNILEGLFLLNHLNLILLLIGHLDSNEYMNCIHFHLIFCII